MVLLQDPNLEYLRKLQSASQEDPYYLYHHELSVGLRVRRMLISAGIQWDRDTHAQYWTRVLRVALEKIRGD